MTTSSKNSNNEEAIGITRKVLCYPQALDGEFFNKLFQLAWRSKNVRHWYKSGWCLRKWKTSLFNCNFLHSIFLGLHSGDAHGTKMVHVNSINQIYQIEPVCAMCGNLISECARTTSGPHDQSQQEQVTLGPQPTMIPRNTMTSQAECSPSTVRRRYCSSRGKF